jgi:hypothetical protein
MPSAMKKKILLSLLAAFLLLPGWLWLAWWLQPKRRLTVAIIDKTVSGPTPQEHLSLDWVLNQERFTKTATRGYGPGADYFGFFPGSDRHYRLRGLERFRPGDLDRLAADADLTYFTDTYGVYTAEWYGRLPPGSRSTLLYGGMSEQDIAFLRAMKARHKTAIAEFNSIGSPTPAPIRQEFESLYGLHWLGWTARYFPLLDTMRNPDLPRWLVDNYRAAHSGAWPFHRDGMAWVNNDGRVVVLEAGSMLRRAVPCIKTTPAASGLGLPDSIGYPFWFDVLEPDTAAGPKETLAMFDIDVNPDGARLLGEYGIPARCPAILRHMGADYGFYYFSGDFCDNPIGYTSSYFKGAAFFEDIFRGKVTEGDRTPFFWDFYRPLLSGILDSEYHRARTR